MLIRRGWNQYLDIMRDELWKNHPQIKIVDFERFNLNVFNQCESENNIMTVSYTHLVDAAMYSLLAEDYDKATGSIPICPDA